jgi:hypothetical protein
VKGFEGHHINSVKGNDLKMAADPNNIKFVEGRAGNLAEHGGNFQNETSGPLIDRIAKLGGAGMLAFFATYDQKMNEYSSQSPIISSPDSWWSNINPANYMVETAALAEAFVAADAADREAKKREEEERKKQGGAGSDWTAEEVPKRVRPRDFGCFFSDTRSCRWIGRLSEHRLQGGSNSDQGGDRTRTALALDNGGFLQHLERGEVIRRRAFNLRLGSRIATAGPK